jgi:tetratricopeptide (TPR) repeat protein
MGAKHPELSWTLGELAGVLQAAGDIDAAIDRRREAVEICRTAWGDHHRTTSDALLRLAQTLASAGRSDEAERIYTQALANLTRYKGPMHAATRSAREAFEQWLPNARRPNAAMPEALVAATDARDSGSSAQLERGSTPARDARTGKAQDAPPTAGAAKAKKK